jgi:uncharacterized membrane protein
MIYGLTPLGVVHTLLSLVAVAAGLYALIRDRQISLDNPLGKLYALTTAVTCLTGFGIFQHGGFGKPHALGILTLIALGVALLANRGMAFGMAARYVEVVALSATFLFHLIPAITETTTRLPLGAPLLPNADAPQLQTAAGVLALLFLVGATLQVLRLRRRG